MAWRKEDFYDGARSQGHDLGVTNREVRDTAQLAEYLMTTAMDPMIDRSAVLKDFGFGQVDAPAATFYIRIIGKRRKRPTEVVAFFVVRTAEPPPGVRFVGFSPLSDYRKHHHTLDDAMSIAAFFAQQD